MATRTVESKSRQSKYVPVPKKTCPICQEKKPYSDFYTNKDWAQENGTDRWCKACFARLSSKTDLQEYFWENHRQWNEEAWQKAVKQAEKKLEGNATYARSTDTMRRSLLEKTAIQNMPLIMQQHYTFIPEDDSGKHLSFMEAVEKGIVVVNDDDPNTKKYSEFFNGYFNQRELEYLANYYDKLEEDFVLDNENIRDYAKKCARASLQADKAQDDYAAGRCSFADVKDALTQFDMLSKSANFAACKRKTGETSGLTCWAETTLYLETHGYCKENKIEWPQDDVDRVVASLSHTVRALGLDSI